MFPTGSPTSAPTGSSMSPTAVPTAAPSAAPTPVAGTVTGSLTVSGLDEETEDEEVYEAAREGLSELFGLSSVGGVAVAAPGTLDSDEDDDPAATATASPSPTPVVGTTAAVGVADSDGVGAGTEQVIGVDGRRRRRVSEMAPQTLLRYDPRDDARSLSHYQQETAPIAEAREPLGGGGLGRQRRWMQEDEEGSGSETVDMDFEVSVPADDGETGSAASRVAAVVNDFADSGLSALADSLGVEPEDLSLSDLAFCIGSTDCGNVSTVVSTMSVVDELGTSGPWENFLTNGGLLLLALFGTLCVCFCAAGVCFHCLFNGGGYEDVELLKPVPAVPAKHTVDKDKEQVSPGVLDLSRMPNRRLGVPDGDKHSDGDFPSGSRGDSKMGGGDFMEAGIRTVSPATSKTTVGSVHWMSQFGHKNSAEYDLQNPLRGPGDSVEGTRRFGDIAMDVRARWLCAAFEALAGVRTKGKTQTEEAGLIGHYGDDRSEGEFKTTNPMFLGADLDSASPSPSPQPMPPSLAPLGSGTGGVSSSGGGGGVSLASNNPLFGTGGSSSSSLLSASNAAGAGGAVRRGALSGSRSPPSMLGAPGNRSSNGSIGRMSSAEVATAVLSERDESSDGSEDGGDKLPGDDALPDIFVARRSPTSAAGGGGSVAEAGRGPAGGGRGRVVTPTSSLGGGGDVYGGLASASPSVSPAVVMGGSSAGRAAAAAAVAAAGSGVALAAQAGGGESGSEDGFSEDAAASAWSDEREGLRPSSKLPLDPSQKSSTASATTTTRSGTITVAEEAAAVARPVEEQQQGTEGAPTPAPASAERRPGVAEQTAPTPEASHTRRGSGGGGGGGGISAWKNTWQGLMSVGSSRGRNRTQAAGTASSPSRQSQSRQHRRHQSATARWSSPRHAPAASEPGTGSISSGSTSTGRIVADVLSHPTISAESDFSLSEVFAGAVSPAGLAAAAAASSATDLFRLHQGGAPSRPVGAGAAGAAASAAAPSAQAVTPRARTGGGAGGSFGGGSPSPPVLRAGRVVAAVAEAAAETAAEEAAKKRAAERTADEAAAAAAAAAGRSGVQPAIGGGATREVSTPEMQGASMPGRLGSPQELSPTTPPTTKREDPVADSAAAARRGGGGVSEAAAMTPDPAEVSGGDGRTVLGRLGLTLSSHNEVFPSRVMLSPGTDSDPGSSPSPEVLVRRSSRPFSGGDAGQEGFAPPPQAGDTSAHKEEEAELGGGAQSAVTHQPTPSPDDFHAGTISPPSASDSSLGSNLWCSGPFARSSFGKSMGGQGADEARDGLLATRSGKMRALGTLDLMQVND
ncbi:unnamed protein product [Ectocarpus fasciculatus]